jgi:hypothetical protein
MPTTMTYERWWYCPSGPVGSDEVLTEWQQISETVTVDNITNYKKMNPTYDEWQTTWKLQNLWLCSFKNILERILLIKISICVEFHVQ